MSSALRWPLLLAATSLTWGLAAPSQAQEGVSSIDDIGEVIVVTAQKRDELIEDVPIAMTVVSGEELENSGIARMEDLDQVVPGLQVGFGGSNIHPAIRGISTTRPVLPENNVATYIDGYYIATPKRLNMELVNLDSVQVLRGPQGTLFGRNATGGAILLETLDPSFSGVTGRVSAGYGSFNDHRFLGYISTPVTDNFAISLGGAYRENEGYIRDAAGFDTAPLTTWSGNFRALLELTENFTISADLGTFFVEDSRAQARTIVGRSSAAALFPTIPTETDHYRTSFTNPPEIWTRGNFAGVTMEYDFGAATLRSLTSYQHDKNYFDYEGDGSPAFLFRNYFSERFRTWTEELNLTSNDSSSAFQYVFGLFYLNQTASVYDNYYNSYPSTVMTRREYADQEIEAYAAYADLTFRVTENLFLTGGLRYSNENQHFERHNGSDVLLIDTNASFDSTTPRVVIRYQLDDDSNVYASYSQGFKGGIINNSPPYAVARPESITAYEIGYKVSRPGYRFDVAGYYYDYTDLQVGAIVVINGVNNNLTTNAASAEIYGVEAQWSGDLTDNLSARLGIAYNHARYVDFDRASVFVVGSNGRNTGNCPTAASPCTQDQSGQRLPRAPDWSVNLGADYLVPLGGEAELVLSGNGNYTSAFPVQVSDIGIDAAGNLIGGYRYEQSSVFLLNFQAALYFPGDTTTLTLFANNVTDELTYIALGGSNFGDFEVLGEPATYGIRLDYRF